MQVDREEYLAIRTRWLDAQKEMRLIRLGIERMEAGKDPMRSPLAFLEASVASRKATSATDYEHLSEAVSMLSKWLEEERKRFDEECAKGGVVVADTEAGLACPTCKGERGWLNKACPDIFHGRPCTACDGSGAVRGARCEPCFGSGIRFIPREGATS